MQVRIMRWMLPVLGLAALGCQTYQNVRVRPVDTTSQLVLPGVDVRVAPAGSPGEGALLGTTDEHGQFKIEQLRSGETILLTRPGFEPAVIRVGLGYYRVHSPAGEPGNLRHGLTSNETIPVPLHRSGEVRRPETPAPIR